MTWFPLALLSAFFASLVAIFGKIGLEKIDTTVATMVRSAFMFMILLGIVIVSGKWQVISTLNGKALLFIVLAGTAGALSWVFYFWALKVGKVSQIVPIDRLSIIIAIALAALFLGEGIGLKTGLGSALMVAGAILIALS